MALGIDVGGTGVKAAMIDLATAELVTSRVREKTPQPSKPAAVIETIASVVDKVLAEYGPVKDLPVGCGLPGPIKYGRMKMAANLDKGWVDFDATGVLGERLGRQVHVINDADAAGMAELAYGEARDRQGTTILLTIGTGIGSALISEGRLVPNTEFGHLLMHDQASETLVSGVARERRGLKWKEWAVEFNEYLAMLEFFFWPDRIILGGGVSKRSDKYWDVPQDQRRAGQGQVPQHLGHHRCRLRRRSGRPRRGRAQPQPRSRRHGDAPRRRTGHQEARLSARRRPTAPAQRAGSTSSTPPTSSSAPTSGGRHRPASTVSRSGATLGVVESVLSLLREDGVTHLGCATDHVIRSWRNDRYPGYKTDEGMPPELLAQFELVEEALRALGVVVWPMVEFEADDGLAAAAARFVGPPRRRARGHPLP